MKLLRLRAFQYHLVRDKRDKFPVRGLIVCCVNLNAENAVDIFDFAAIPGDFDCVSYRALDLAAARVELIGNRRIQFLVMLLMISGVSTAILIASLKN